MVAQDLMLVDAKKMLISEEQQTVVSLFDAATAVHDLKQVAVALLLKLNSKSYFASLVLKDQNLAAMHWLARAHCKNHDFQFD